jgi:hypothetical protein
MVVEALLNCYLFYLGNELILIHIRKLCRSSACLVRIAGPCPAEPFQLVPAQLGLTPAGSYQLCTRHRNAACSQHKGAVPLAALPFPQPLFPPAPSSSSRLALCPPTRCRSVLAMQVTAPILPLESPAAPHPPPRPGPGTSPTTSPVGRPLSRPRG